ncbi:unnamed protein product, partial [marine sediment metagenome]
IGNGTEIEITGIRAGEKVHEVLVSKDEARNAIELEDRYVILPDKYPNWNYEGLSGEAIKTNFEYTSENNKDFLSRDQIREMVR